VQAAQSLGYIDLVAHPDHDDDAVHPVGQSSVDQVPGDQLLVRNQQLLFVPITHGGRADPDLGDSAGGVPDRDDISHPDRLLEQEYEPADEVGHDLLESETDTHTKGGHQPLHLGLGKPQDVENREAGGDDDAVTDEGPDRVAIARGHGDTMQQQDLSGGRADS